MQQMAVRPLRDTERIERICAPIEARVRLVLRTASLCRTVRKDFNIVTTKMFLARGAKVAALSFALRELERACVEAELAAETFRANYEVEFLPQAFELRIVSPSANRYVRSITRLDAANGVLIAAETRGAIERRLRHKIVRPCLALLFAVKRLALDLPTREEDPPIADRFGSKALANQYGSSDAPCAARAPHLQFAMGPK